MNTDQSDIFFLRTSGDFGCFSNFFVSGFYYDDRWWKSSEHCYQAFKFTDKKIQERIRSQPNAFMAAREGRSKQYPLRHDWDLSVDGDPVKEKVMYEILKAKFTQNKALRDILLSTGNRMIYELSYRDQYWGTLPDKSGKNRLGVLLMRLRDELRLTT